MPDLLRLRALGIFWLSLLLLSPALAAPQAQEQPRVLFVTSEGNFIAELYPQKAPVAVKNFLRYVRADFYDGTIFHRVVGGFVIQGGGYTPDFQRKPTPPPIENKAGSGLDVRGTLAMTLDRDPDSVTSQFFINLRSNPGPNHSPSRAGYTVFGKIVEGMHVVDKIARTETGPAGPFPRAIPRPAVVILDMQIL